MKNKLLSTIVLALLVLAQSSFAQTIVGTKHDFSGAAWNAWASTPSGARYGGQICKVCHTPHGAQTGIVAPLWNHMLSTVTNYTLYSNAMGTFDGAATIGQPDASSKLCLSCHDGTVALENFGRGAAMTTTGTTYNTGIYNFGTDLSNDHPISFTYDDALATTDGGLFKPSSTVSGLTPSGTIQSDMLILDKMQCSSCHDVHNSAGVANLLRKSNAKSALCLTCHDK